MKIKTLVLMTLIISLVALSFAQMGNQRFARRQNLRANRYQTFDVTSPVQINGAVVTVNRRSNGFGRYRDGIELLMSSDGKNITVRIGPTAYLVSCKWQFKKGDKIQLTAYNGTGQCKGMLFAAKISMNGKTLILRDENGVAQWRYSNRGRRGRW